MTSIQYGIKERQYADILCSLLSSEFDITREKEIQKAPGKFYLDGSDHKVVPDLLIRPKSFLIKQYNFPDTLIPIEIKVMDGIELNKFEDLMFQCHTYRFSTFQGLQPKLCLFFIDNYFEGNRADNAHLHYDYQQITDHRSRDYIVWKRLNEKSKIEILFGRFGIGEILTKENGYIIKLKRCVLFEKDRQTFTCKPSVLTFWRGTKGNKRGFK